MFARFTERARRVIFFARFEAFKTGSSSITAEHLLLGLWRENRALLEEIPPEVDLQSMRALLFSSTTSTTALIDGVDVGMPIGESAKHAIWRADAEAETDVAIASGHILLGVLAQTDTLASKTLARYGISMENIRQRVNASVESSFNDPPNPAIFADLMESAGAPEPNGDAACNVSGSVNPPESVSGLAGIDLISPIDESFDRMAEKLAPGWEKVVAAAKPLVAIVSNNSGRRVVAFTTCFTMARGTATSTFYGQIKDTDALSGAGMTLREDPSEHALLPGASRVVGMSSSLPPFRQEFEPMMLEYTRYIEGLSKDVGPAQLLSIAIDAVLFDDGELVGPNVGALDKHFAAMMSMKQALYRTIIDVVGGRAPFDKALDIAEEAMMIRRESLEERLRLYADEAVAEVRNYGRKHGPEQTLSIVRQLLLNYTFTIRK